MEAALAPASDLSINLAGLRTRSVKLVNTHFGITGYQFTNGKRPRGLVEGAPALQRSLNGSFIPLGRLMIPCPRTRWQGAHSHLT
jgi:hypothetical protein